MRISDGWTQEATYDLRYKWSVMGVTETERDRHHVLVKRLPSN